MPMFLTATLFAMLIVASSDNDPQTWLNCENYKQLVFEQRALKLRTVGFSDAFTASHGTWRGRSVTVIHAVDRTITPSKAVQAELSDFIHTLATLQGHVGTQLIRGYCVERALLVEEFLHPWSVVSATKLPWCVKLHASLSAARLFEFLEGDWHRRPRGTVLLCDLDGHDLGFSRDYVAKLVNLQHVNFVDELPAFANNCQSTEDCTKSCMRRYHENLHIALSEFVCDKQLARCMGFEPSVHAFALTRSVYVKLLAVLADAPPRVVERVPIIVQDATVLHRRDRLTCSDIADELEQLLRENDGLSCLARHNVTLHADLYKTPRATRAAAAARWHHQQYAIDAADNVRRWPALPVHSAPLVGYRRAANERADSEDDDGINDGDVVGDDAIVQPTIDLDSREPDAIVRQHIQQTQRLFRAHNNDAYFDGLKIAHDILKGASVPPLSPTPKKHHKQD